MLLQEPQTQLICWWRLPCLLHNVCHTEKFLWACISIGSEPLRSSALGRISNRVNLSFPMQASNLRDPDERANGPSIMLSSMRGPGLCSAP